MSARRSSTDARWLQMGRPTFKRKMADLQGESGAPGFEPATSPTR